MTWTCLCGSVLVTGESRTYITTLDGGTAIELPGEGPPSSEAFHTERDLTGGGIASESRIAPPSTLAEGPLSKDSLLRTDAPPPVEKESSTVDDIEDRIAEWHASAESAYQPLHEYLGMTWEEYAAWVERREARRPPWRTRLSHSIFGCSAYAFGGAYARRCRICGKRLGW